MKVGTRSFNLVNIILLSQVPWSTSFQNILGVYTSNRYKSTEEVYENPPTQRNIPLHIKEDLHGASQGNFNKQCSPHQLNPKTYQYNSVGTTSLDAPYDQHVHGNGHSTHTQKFNNLEFGFEGYNQLVYTPGPNPFDTDHHQLYTEPPEPFHQGHNPRYCDMSTNLVPLNSQDFMEFPHLDTWLPHSNLGQLGEHELFRGQQSLKSHGHSGVNMNIIQENKHHFKTFDPSLYSSTDSPSAQIGDEVWPHTQASLFTGSTPKIPFVLDYHTKSSKRRSKNPESVVGCPSDSSFGRNPILKTHISGGAPDPECSIIDPNSSSKVLKDLIHTYPCQTQKDGPRDIHDSRIDKDSSSAPAVVQRKRKFSTSNVNPNTANFVADIEARGRYLAEPLLPRGEVESFFKDVRDSLVSQVENLEPSHVNSTKKAIDVVRGLVTHKFLGILQLMHQTMKFLSGAEGDIPDLNGMDLEHEIAVGWNFLKDTFELWKGVKMVQNGVSIFDQSKNHGAVEVTDFSCNVTLLRYLTQFQDTDNTNILEKYLYHLVKRWHANTSRNFDGSLNAYEYMSKLALLHKITGDYNENVHPCLNFVRITGADDIRRMGPNLQKRGKYTVDTLLPIHDVERFFMEVSANIDENHPGLDKKTRSMVYNACSRLEGWVIHRFLGALQVIYVHGQETIPVTGQNTLQEEVKMGWDFLKEIFGNLKRVFLGPKSDLVPIRNSRVPEDMNWSDVGQVLLYYMKVPPGARAPNHYVWYLIGRYFKLFDDLEIQEGKYKLGKYRDLFVTCYVSPLGQEKPHNLP